MQSSSVFMNMSVRYYMHSWLKASFSDHNNFFDMGVGIVIDGFGGVAVSILRALDMSELEYYIFGGFLLNKD